MSCGRMIGPYHCCSVVQGDCLLLMKELPDGCVDAVITDPPYGINFNFTANRFRTGLDWRAGNIGSDYTSPWSNVIGDDSEFDPRPLLGFNEVIIWGAQNFSHLLPRSRGWLIWDKLGDKPPCDFGDCEMAWTSIDMPVRIHRQLWRGVIREGQENAVNGPKLHPCQKPISLILWCLSFVKGQTILDPFLGSGTTAVAAKKLGRHFLGFEISEEYCRIARERIALVEAQPTLFESKGEQMELAP